MPYFANACRVKNQRICQGKRPPKFVTTLVARVVSGAGTASPLIGYSDGSRTGGSIGGELDPTSFNNTQINAIMTTGTPPPPTNTKQLQLYYTGNKPLSLTITGGDLTAPYTLNCAQASSPANNLLVWVGADYPDMPNPSNLFAVDTTYTVTFRY